MTRFILAMAALTALAACSSAPDASDERAAHEGHACAELGLSPGSPGFDSCVGNLEATIQQNNYGGYR